MNKVKTLLATSLLVSSLLSAYAPNDATISVANETDQTLAGRIKVQFVGQLEDGIEFVVKGSVHFALEPGTSTEIDLRSATKADRDPELGFETRREGKKEKANKKGTYTTLASLMDLDSVKAVKATKIKAWNADKSKALRIKADFECKGFIIEETEEGLVLTPAS